MPAGRAVSIGIVTEDVVFVGRWPGRGYRAVVELVQDGNNQPEAL